MRENRTYGSEGGEGANPSRPLSYGATVRVNLLQTGSAWVSALIASLITTRTILWAPAVAGATKNM
jgi:hypothetical protein